MSSVARCKGVMEKFMSLQVEITAHLTFQHLNKLPGRVSFPMKGTGSYRHLSSVNIEILRHEWQTLKKINITRVVFSHFVRHWCCKFQDCFHWPFCPQEWFYAHNRRCWRWDWWVLPFRRELEWSSRRQLISSEIHSTLAKLSPHCYHWEGGTGAWEQHPPGSTAVSSHQPSGCWTAPHNPNHNPTSALELNRLYTAMVALCTFGLSWSRLFSITDNLYVCIFIQCCCCV